MAARILVVDDDDLIRMVLVDTLRDAGYEVLEAAEAEDALMKLVEPDDIAVVVTDVRMPGSKDGLELAMSIRALYGPLPVIIVTGYAEHLQDRLEALGEPLRFFQKPYRPSEIVEAVRGCLPAAP